MPLEKELSERTMAYMRSNFRGKAEKSEESSEGGEDESAFEVLLRDVTENDTDISIFEATYY